MLIAQLIDTLIEMKVSIDNNDNTKIERNQEKLGRLGLSCNILEKQIINEYRPKRSNK
tara:strand:- start:2615 stop:2788 length:174 start_codon:yes stop_codon:yes gene_type:complete